jgi:AbrB family looped-hinge helix DNA binding protein
MQVDVVPTTMTSRVTRKGQVTIPVAIRRLLGVCARDQVAFVVTNGAVRVAAATSVVARTAGMLKSDLPMRAADEESRVVEEAMAAER